MIKYMYGIKPDDVFVRMASRMLFEKCINHSLYWIILFYCCMMF